ncbi:hypothetical protein ATCC90586_011882 [Pythium insidiosum]|nr:hypothetical protein ATCC90586_011882 [Pythium insidiosum]
MIAIADFYVFAFGVTPPKHHELGHNPCTFSTSTSSVGVASLSSQTPEPESKTDMKIYKDTDIEMKRSAPDAPLPCACGCEGARQVDMSAWTRRADEMGHAVAHTPDGVFCVPDTLRQQTPLEHYHVVKRETALQLSALGIWLSAFDFRL